MKEGTIHVERGFKTPIGDLSDKRTLPLHRVVR